MNVNQVKQRWEDKTPDGTKVISYSAVLDEAAWVPSVVGIDPGQVNMGIALISGSAVTLYQIELPRTNDTVERVVQVMEITEALLHPHLDNEMIHRACVEQAAYGALYGQASLAEARTATVVGLLKIGTKQIEVVPPRKIRQTVFGDGKIKAEEVWADDFLKQGKDAASALGCALYARHQLLKGD